MSIVAVLDLAGDLASRRHSLLSRESWSQRLTYSSQLLSQTFDSHTGVDQGLGEPNVCTVWEGSL